MPPRARLQSRRAGRLPGSAAPRPRSRPARWRSHWSRRPSMAASRFSSAAKSLSRCSKRARDTGRRLRRPRARSYCEPPHGRVRLHPRSISGCEPRRESHGIRCVIEAQRESMVRMQSRFGFSARPQPRAASRCRTARASRHVSALCASRRLRACGLLQCIEHAPPASPQRLCA